jgi:hypothetical protein
MMRTKPMLAVLAAALAATTLLAQEPQPKASPKPNPKAEKAEARRDKEPPPRPGQLANVRVDVKITDERSGQPPVMKQLSLTVADRREGFIRSSPQFQIQMPNYNAGQLPLNVDASPVIDGGRIRLSLGLEYFSVQTSTDPKQFTRDEIRDRLQVVLEDGKALRVAQSADPMSDRRVSVEVTATILR